MVQIRCHQCRKKRSVGAEPCPHCGEAGKGSEKARPKRWYEKTSVTLCVAAALAVVGLGFIHIITGVEPRYALPFDVARKASFGYRETFVDADKILALPYSVAKTKYPIGCRVLQDRGHMSSGRRFEVREAVASWDNIRRWQEQFDQSYGQEEPPWQETLGYSIDVSQPNLAEALACNRRGVALAREDRYAEAIAEFTRAIGKAPTQMHAYRNRAFVHMALGNLGQAAADFGKVVEIAPGAISGHFRLGRLHMAMNQYDEAISDFSRVLQFDPQCIEAYFRRSLAHYAKGQYDQAWDDAARLPRLNASVPSEFLAALERALGR